MARRRFLMAYDISDPKRLRRVCKVMESYGERLQYSVFLCDLSDMELTRWKMDMLNEMSLTLDSVVRIDLGPLGASASIEMLGSPRRLPRGGPTIV